MTLVLGGSHSPGPFGRALSSFRTSSMGTDDEPRVLRRARNAPGQDSTLPWDGSHRPARPLTGMWRTLGSRNQRLEVGKDPCAKDLDIGAGDRIAEHAQIELTLIERAPPRQGSDSRPTA